MQATHHERGALGLAHNHDLCRLVFMLLDGRGIMLEGLANHAARSRSLALDSLQCLWHQLGRRHIEHVL